MADADDQMVECNRRMGIPLPLLRSAPPSVLRECLEATAHETLVEAAQARRMLAAEEMPRVYDFIDHGSPSRRSLLTGIVGVDEFLDSFLVLDNIDSRALLDGGRSLRSVVESIRCMGGMERAAMEIPWLRKCLPLVRNLDWSRLARQLIFVRRASAQEAASAPCAGQGMYVEEGQHRAIAAAWNLTGGSSRGCGAPSRYDVLRPLDSTQPTTITYLRGVNREGAEHGHPFWDVASRPPRLALLNPWSCGCALLACLLARSLLRRRRRRQRREDQGIRRERVRGLRAKETFLLGLRRRWLSS